MSSELMTIPNAPFNISLAESRKSRVTSYTNNTLAYPGLRTLWYGPLETTSCQ
jgi:hypothetical protein